MEMAFPCDGGGGTEGRYSNIFLPHSTGSKCRFHSFCKNAMVAADMDQLGLEVVVGSRWTTVPHSLDSSSPRRPTADTDGGSGKPGFREYDISM